ncbi:hypothetical protein M758_UG315300 [Ceratodon purpureus]|nr:hypothetical protein M758_UG315300 [Ceratodon purpureus]
MMVLAVLFFLRFKWCIVLWTFPPLEKSGPGQTMPFSTDFQDRVQTTLYSRNREMISETNAKVIYSGRA